METKDLIKKLENIDIPEVEIKSHKAGLRFALLNSDYFKKTDFLEVFKRYFYFAVPVFATALAILAITVIQPKLTEAKVLGIAKDNPEIKKLIEEKNMALSDVKIKDGKAYVLLNSPSDANPITEKNSVITLKKVEQNASDDIEGAIVEVNLKNKQVDQINSINSDEINPLNDEEKNSAEDIVQSEEIIGNIIPKEATIEKIQSYLPREIHLEDEDGGVKAVSRPDNSDGDKKARVQYNLDGKKWVVKVNLDEKVVEEIQYSTDDKKVDERNND